MIIYHPNKVCSECRAITHNGEHCYECPGDCDFKNQLEWGKANEDPFYKLAEMVLPSIVLKAPEELSILKQGQRLIVEYEVQEDGQTYIVGVNLVEDKEVLWTEEWNSEGSRTMIDNSKLADLNMDGVQVEFISGAKRVEASIPDYSGIPPFILRRLALIFEEGRQIYGERNWTKGLPTSSTMNHLIEHLMRWMEGDTTEDHLSKAMWGIVCLMYTMEHHADCHDADWSNSVLRTDNIFRATNSNP